MPPLRIAILGTRGIPANYGGFETFAEECAAGLAERGHEVTVYVRAQYATVTGGRYRSIRLVTLPTLRWKYTDTVVHTFLSALHALGGRYDVLLICNAANSIFSVLPRMLGTPVVVNVDGIERLRQKWNWIGRLYYRLSEYLSTILPNIMVTDAGVMADYYKQRYGAESVFIPYGAATRAPEGREALHQLGLQERQYFLYVGRLEPENNAHRVIQAFGQIRTSHRLVIVGDAPYARSYIRKIRETRDSRVLFAGAIYGARYLQLQSHAFCYIHATEVGGTHPALIEAMGQGNLVVANGTPENAEVLADTGLLYQRNDADDLARCLQEVADHPDRFQSLREAARKRVIEHYSWTDVVARYEKLFLDLVHHRRGAGPAARPQGDSPS